jgi:hypothetical protein
MLLFFYCNTENVLYNSTNNPSLVLSLTLRVVLLSPPQAYSVYDEEIGYCQGQSFLAAVLLLHVSYTWQQQSWELIETCGISISLPLSLSPSLPPSLSPHGLSSVMECSRLEEVQGRCLIPPSQPSQVPECSLI